MPSKRQVRRVTSKHRPRSTCKTICLILLILLALTIPPFLLLYLRPYHRALAHELSYFSELQRLDQLDSQWLYRPDNLPDSPRKPPAHNNRTLPLVHDIPQLSSWDFQAQMDLHADGTGRHPGREAWVYFGGTPRRNRLMDRISAFQRPNGSCINTGDICAAYNEGFNAVIERFHVDRGVNHGGKRTSKAFFAFADCDVSPLMCDNTNQWPVSLLHLKTIQPCKVEHHSEVRWTCGMRYTSVRLPLRRMPFKKTQTIAGYVVPVFPSALEQLHAMLAWDGSTEALAALEEGSDYIDIVEALPKVEDVQEDD
ncbi:unnamed protein product [Diplocarpon coronariae]|uniref:Uncharacterized protein n=1 Tax=Diplocarpon coronariae TaxID=2795749 RepID=A0A218Z850_9HELO|nr:hypothetical protein B2J93_180 [Marssonina coronariae]